ncbi:hypothetical protein PDIG_71350 [Penicillium digitatum PHI26]|uniref:Uncharacterized protein n=2 Tax=Penicillium digitatum TaxID=36651 RepID=K9FE44_PEND2|nr:hypothetical protein PDIP_80650 [Penicillium digitatum Pd1]EKV06063.1 hypothetical protein PDIP_80650 [Penicillium digitatum Pd1]EKV07705.1 hypothetical protein PDIG_71350 [Penicillium digitatum PHI26]
MNKHASPSDNDNHFNIVLQHSTAIHLELTVSLKTGRKAISVLVLEHTGRPHENPKLMVRQHLSFCLCHLHSL